MRKRTRQVLITTSLVTAVLLLIIVILYLGKFITPYYGVIIFEVAFNFVFIPQLIGKYYKSYGMKPPSLIVRLIPFYNVTLIMNPNIARLVILDLALLVCVYVLSLNISMFTVLFGERGMYILMDVLPTSAFIVSFIYFILVGIGLAGVAIKINKFHTDSFIDMDLEDEKSGIARFFGMIMSSSKFIEIIMYSLPVFRVIALGATIGKLDDLDASGFMLSNYTESN